VKNLSLDAYNEYGLLNITRDAGCCSGNTGYCAIPETRAAYEQYFMK